MSKIYVSEFSGLANTDQSDSVPILAIPALAEYTVIVSGGVSVSAQPIQAATKFIEISTDTTCSFVIGTAGGSAALTNCRLNANDRVIRRVPTSAGPVGQSQGGQLAPVANFILTTANV
jgi:hypothetical protein